MIKHILTDQEGLHHDGVAYSDRPQALEVPMCLNWIASEVSPEVFVVHILQVVHVFPKLYDNNWSQAGVG